MSSPNHLMRIPRVSANDTNRKRAPRGRLDMTKCEYCRKDKQKCKPVERQWPRRCDRCSERDLPCSEPKKADRRPKKRIALQESPQRSLNSSDATIEEQIYKAEFLLAYHKNLILARDQLLRLQSEIKELFGFADSTMRNVSDIDFWLKAFEKLCDQISTLGMETTNHILSLSSRGNISLTQSNMIMQLFQKHSQAVFSDCLLCDTNEEEHTINSTAVNYPSNMEAVLALQQLLSHIVAVGTGSHIRKDDLPSIKRFSSFREICKESRKATDAVVKVNGVVCPFSYYLTHFIPDSIFAKPPATIKILDASFPDKPESGHTMKTILDAYLPEVGMRDCLGRTSLHIVLDIYKPEEKPAAHEIVSWLDDYFSNPETALYLNGPDLLGRTPLHIACQKGLYKVANHLLNDDPRNNLGTAYFSRPIHYAARGGSVKICDQLLSKDNYNFGDCSGTTPFGYAIETGNTSLLDVFLSYPLRDFQAPYLIQAIQRGKAWAVKHVLQSGADANVEFNNKTALCHAADQAARPGVGQEEQFEILKYLISLNIKAEFLYLYFRPRTGSTILHYLAFTGYAEGIEYVLQDTDIDSFAKDDRGWTALMHATRAPQEKVKGIIKLLLADCSIGYLEAKDNIGHNAVSMLRDRGLWDLADWLEDIILSKRTQISDFDVNSS